ncbi:hypothetical protein PVAND_016786 [Polypedilum vanderplanki]|uniref:Kazal-like domain-containing protein n=1 Tax=Polypedilum vanderplanki TaxID=319348 RepID=A0A9J6BGN5_POLVA|nr:hypothetical protein PVAND_016786 [Polypedilum vanderplanki]
MDLVNFHLNRQKDLLQQDLISFNDENEMNNFVELPATDSSSMLVEPLITNRIQDCVDSCIMTTPGQYDPVCGSDEQDYHNEQRLDCARDCGVEVTLLRRGTCVSLLSAVVLGTVPQ